MSGGKPALSRGSLVLLHRVLSAQQLAVGNPDFRDTAAAVLVALDELEAVLASTAEGSEGPA